MNCDHAIDLTTAQAKVLYAVMGAMPARLGGLTHHDFAGEIWSLLRDRFVRHADVKPHDEAVEAGILDIARHVCAVHSEDHGTYSEEAYSAAITLLADSQHERAR